MTKHLNSRFAGTAIAAVLALGTTPALAQDVTAPAASPPPIVLPPVATTPPPVTTPEPAPLTLPDVEPAPEPAPSAAAPTQRTAAPVRSRASAAAPQTTEPRRDEPVATAPIVGAPATPETAPAVEPAANDTAVPPPVSAPVATEVVSEDGIGDELLLGGGLLAALGLAGLGFAATRRRRRTPMSDRVDDATYVKPRPVEPIEARHVPAAPLAAAPSPSVTYAQSMPARPAAAQSWTSPASFTLPATLPSDPNERRELLKRMVAAQPDEANPFKTRKARMRRARIILATREAQASRAPAERIAPRAAEPARQREFEDA